MDLRDHRGRIARLAAAIGIAVPFGVLVSMGGSALLRETDPSGGGRGWFELMTFCFAFALIAFAIHAWLSALAKRVPLQPTLPRARVRR